MVLLPGRLRPGLGLRPVYGHWASLVDRAPLLGGRLHLPQDLAAASGWSSGGRDFDDHLLRCRRNFCGCVYHQFLGPPRYYQAQDVWQSALWRLGWCFRDWGCGDNFSIQPSLSKFDFNLLGEPVATLEGFQRKEYEMKKWLVALLVLAILLVGCDAIVGEDEPSTTTSATITPAGVPGRLTPTPITALTQTAAAPTQTKVPTEAPTQTSVAAAPVGDSICAVGVTLYEHDGVKRSEGWMLLVKETVVHLKSPHFGAASEISVPSGCSATLYDVAPIGSGGHTLLISGPKVLNLQKIKRDPLSGDTRGTCEDNLPYCWSDHVVAIGISGETVAKPTRTATPRPAAPSPSPVASGAKPCAEDPILYQNDDANGSGWKLSFNGETYGRSSERGFPNYDGSALRVPAHCKVVVYDQHKGGGHSMTFPNSTGSPITFNLQEVQRDPLQWEIDQNKRDTCKNGLANCWSDHVVDGVANLY